MPELPEVEILVRHLQPILRNREISGVQVHRAKSIRPESLATLATALVGRQFENVRRRAKYLLFDLRLPVTKRTAAIAEATLIGHLGMTGRMYVQPKSVPLPKHAAVSLDLGRDVFVFEDSRYFGRFNLDVAALAKLGPEPWAETLTPESLRAALQRSGQSIKVKLLDQTLLAGIGNIYASEALFRAGISPGRRANQLRVATVARLLASIREVLAEAIRLGSTIPLSLESGKSKNRLFYYGSTEENSDFYQERLLVYNRAGQPCGRCRAIIRHCVQAARSTYWCPQCQT